jgi:hypothetical protein
MGLTLPLEVIENTPPEEIERHTRESSAKYTDWLAYVPAHNTPCVLIAGGASINDHIEDIRKLQNEGATVFTMNGSSRWARKHKIKVDYQVILDAKEETASLVDPIAERHLFASQCHPNTLLEAENLTLWHLLRDGVEELFPEERVRKGGYALVGGDSSVGICSLCVAFTLGYREIHVFGYDTSHREDQGHGYDQKLNDTMPTVEAEWAGKTYKLSLALREQCSNFMTYTQALEADGCKFHVYGDGLLQSIYHTDVNSLSEKDKYRFMWMFRSYAAGSPGQRIADFFVDKFKPTGTVVDFGCGSGKGSIRLSELGLTPLLVDFADNCRDYDAQKFPFLECDLTEEIPINEKYGFCTDVMEHIPTEDVEKAIHNIMGAAEEVFFQISTVDDDFGDLVGATLHHTVRPHMWWKDLFQKLGYKVNFAQNLEVASIYYVSQ